MISSLREFSDKVVTFKDAVQNETHTRTVLIDPVVKILGYDIANPFEVIAEYTSDVGTKSGEKVDYALLKDKEVVMLVEAKDIKFKLTHKYVSQLFRYFSVSSARIALLTNGVEFWFFTDSIKQNIMDSEPFFKFNMLDFTDEEAEIFFLFHKDVINSDKIRLFSMTHTFRKQLTDYFTNQAIAPSNEFVSFIKKTLAVTGLSNKDTSHLIGSEIKRLLETPITLPENTYQEVAVTVEEEVKQVKKKRAPVKNNSFENRLTGLVSLSDFNNKNSSGTKPSELVVADKSYEVTTWSDVLVASIRYCAEIDKGNDFICNLDGLDDDTKGWVRMSNVGMKTPKELDETGIFIDTHGSAVSNIGRVKSIFKQLDINIDDVLLDLKS